MTSRKTSNLTVAKSVLTWSLEDTDGVSKPLTKTTCEAILTNLDKPVSLAKTGDEFSFTVQWLTTGTKKVHDQTCELLHACSVTLYKPRCKPCAGRVPK